MAFWNRWFVRNRDTPSDNSGSIPAGRVTEAGIGKYGMLSPYRSRTTDILEALRRYTEESEAINFLRKVTPDVSMAVWNFLRLANQGHEMHFYSLQDKNKRLPRAEAKWREFAERVGQITNAGLDGVIDQLHSSAFLRGAMGIEAEVNQDRTDIVDVHPIIPQTIQWRLEEREGVQGQGQGKRKVWIPYQQQSMKQVSLEPGEANFYWVPTDPDIDDPRGTLLLTPVLQSIDFQMQILQDLQSVLHHQGWPRNDIKIVLERIMQAMPPDVKGSAVKQKQWLKEKWDEIIDTFKKLEPDSDYVHFDDIEITMAQGANAGRSLDVRAITELVDTQTLSGAKQMAIFMNRNQGVTESWGTVQFRIFVSGIVSIQRGSKRIMEEIARLWLRVQGMQGTPVFTHNTIDWESEEQRMTVRLMEQQFYAIAQLMGWISADQAAQEVVGAEKAASDTPSEVVRISLSMGGERDAPTDNGKGGSQPGKNNRLQVLKNNSRNRQTNG
jgi:hypothetical protein